ncbi:MAG: YgiQ family radical SAM protein [Candidatus Marinimicrobia bacterium]|nr:YgiQ family radical SAM protein [Candidatus Neomarinimicrobiota bacterium]
MKQRGWDQCDVIIVSGDAYIDHPSFGPAIIGRVLENAGFKVGMIAQPDWKSDSDFLKLGKPKLFFAVTAGNIDSMVSHYTVNRKKRRQDLYSPGGKMGLRPNRASIVYTGKLKSLFNKVPVVLGGIEASLRRIAHYDYWDDKLRRSILLDAKADLLIYGMGEKPVIGVARLLQEGKTIEDLEVPGTVSMSKSIPKNAEQLPSWENVNNDKKAYNQSVALHYKYRNPHFSKTVVQSYGNRHLIHFPPPPIMSEKEMDQVYALPYTYSPHPAYGKQIIPAYEQIFGSITSHRGCFGNCTFCAITAHQGSAIQSRSASNIKNEINKISHHTRFKGTITDVGGPSANMYKVACRIGGCKTMDCLFPKVCKHLQVEKQEDYVNLLHDAVKIKGIKHVFIASGLRHDLLLQNKKALKAAIQNFTGGHLKIAPEHIEKEVTDIMNKPDGDIYFAFEKEFEKLSRQANKKQYLVPYFISGHPGSTLESMKNVRDFLKKRGQKLQQAADFYPTPMTLATAMYYTGYHPLTGEKVYTAKTYEEKQKQMRLIFWHKNKS